MQIFMIEIISVSSPTISSELQSSTFEVALQSTLTPEPDGHSFTHTPLLKMAPRSVDPKSVIKSFG
jgi:hypothetical protein